MPVEPATSASSEPSNETDPADPRGDREDAPASSPASPEQALSGAPAGRAGLRGVSDHPLFSEIESLFPGSIVAEERALDATAGEDAEEPLDLAGETSLERDT